MTQIGHLLNTLYCSSSPFRIVFLFLEEVKIRVPGGDKNWELFFDVYNWHHNSCILTEIFHLWRQLPWKIAMLTSNRSDVQIWPFKMHSVFPIISHDDCITSLPNIKCYILYNIKYSHGPCACNITKYESAITVNWFCHDFCGLPCYSLFHFSG